MSLIKIRAALEGALNSMTPTLSTAWENVQFTPVDGTPYQQVTISPTRPDDQEIASKNYQQGGIFQINLRYPLLNGPANAMNRAELIRDKFKKGSSFTNGGVTVLCTRTPEIGTAAQVDGRYFLPVRVFFNSFVGY